MNKKMLLAKIAEARAINDISEVRRLQAYLPVNRRLFEECLTPLFGQEEVSLLLDEVECLKATRQAEYEKATPAPI